jgi:hypothetical protein
MKCRSFFDCRFELLEARLLYASALSFNTWTPIGPQPIAAGQTPGSLSVSGRIYAIAINPTNPSQLFAATGGGGVWRSNDSGADWSPLTDNQSTLFTGAIAIAPSNPNIIYAGTGNPTVVSYAYTGHGILKSMDGGTTWALVGNSTFDRETISQIVVSPTDPNTVYAAVSQAGQNGGTFTGGIFKSTNGGTTWTNTTSSSSGIPGSTGDSFSDLVIDPTNANTLYAAVGTYSGSQQNGVYKTTNGGTTWHLAGNFDVSIPAANGWIKLAISPSSPQTLYASVAASGTIADPTDYPQGTLYRMYKTVDGGTTWSTLSNTPDYLMGAGMFASALAVSPADPNTVYAAGFTGTNSVIRSTNGGQTWTNIATGAGGTGPHMFHHGLAVDPSGAVYEADDGGAFKYDPPSNTWTSLNATLNITQVNGIALDPTNPNIAWAGAQDNGTDKFTGSLSWAQTRNNNGGYVRVDPTNGQTVYHEFSFGTSFFQKSTSGGTSWSTISGVSTADDANFYPPFVLDPSTPTRILLGTDRVYQSASGGSFTPISTVNTNGWTIDSPIDAIAVAKTSSSTIYASAGGNIFVTTNTGATWTARNPIASPSTDLNFSDILVDPTNASIAYVVAANYGDLTNNAHVWKTTNAGVNWTDISGNLPNAPIWSIAMDNAGALYVGAETGIYRATTSGVNWSTVGGGLPNAQVRDLEFNATTNILAAGTYGRGVWEIQAGAPWVLSTTFNDDHAQHMLIFQFTQDVSASLSTADLTVTNRATGAQVATQLLSYNTGTNTATFVFPGFANGTLPDGDYRAVLSGAGVTNNAGIAIQSDTTLTFSHYAGDADHDRAFGTSDFVALSTNFARPNPTFSQGDFNYDGVINAIDFNILATRFGTILPPPASAVALATVGDLFGDEKITGADLEDVIASPTDLVYR